MAATIVMIALVSFLLGYLACAYDVHRNFNRR